MQVTEVKYDFGHLFYVKKQDRIKMTEKGLIKMGGCYAKIKGMVLS